jgi:hypothetical protein
MMEIGLLMTFALTSSNALGSINQLIPIQVIMSLFEVRGTKWGSNLFQNVE